MLDRLVPRDPTDYRGSPIALWLFVPITLVTIGRSLVHVFFADGGAQSIATIPLATYPPPAAGAVVSVFALWGLSQLLLGLVYVVVLWRYRGLVPLMYLLLLAEYAGRFAIGRWKPIATLETPPGAIGNYVFLVVATVLLALSLRHAKGASTA